MQQKKKFGGFKSAYAQELSLQKLTRQLWALALRGRLDVTRKVVGGCTIISPHRFRIKRDPSMLGILRECAPGYLPTEFKLLQFRKPS